MRIFCDLHHSDLYYSLHLLFEKRLGHELYRPIGMDWFDNGFWSIGDPYPDPRDTAGQYLGSDPSLIKNELNREFFANKKVQCVNDVRMCYDEPRDFTHRAITFETFKNTHFDIVMSTYPSHDVTYARLIKLHKPNARHIHQMGNTQSGPTDVLNIMYSLHPSTAPNFKPIQHIVYYTQEFPLDIFKYVPPPEKKRICNFVHIHPRRELFDKYKAALPEFEFRSHGIANEHGAIPLKAVAETMQKSTFGWHVKPLAVPPGGGHCFNNWVASGRPIITCATGEQGALQGRPHQLVSPLIPDETMIDLNAHTFEENVRLIRESSEPERLKQMCERMHELSKSYLNFDEDARRVRAFMDVLK